MLIIIELSLIFFSIKGIYIFNILSKFENYLKIENKNVEKNKMRVYIFNFKLKM